MTRYILRSRQGRVNPCTVPLHQLYPSRGKSRQWVALWRDQQWSRSKGRFEAANRGKCVGSMQLLGGGSRACRSNQAAATRLRPRWSWKKETTDQRLYTSIHPSQTRVLSKLRNKQLSPVEGMKVCWLALRLEWRCGSAGWNSAVSLLISRIKLSKAWRTKCWKSIATALEKMRQMSQTWRQRRC